MDSILGRTILGYKVKEKIGTGGFGDVYRVERNNIVGNVTRALKVITLPKENQYLEVLNSMGGDHKKADEYFQKELDRVVNEIRVFSMISEKDNHNIVSYYENDVEKVGKYKYNIYILMELMTPLDKWLQKNNLTVSEGIDISLDIANALKICHENGIMHRDIKLNNVFVSKDRKFKLGDFGVSKKLDTLTRSHTIKGTPHYIAPEIYVKNEKYDNSADIYSLGILMYYLFNKRRYPFYPDYPDSYEKEDEDKAFYKRMQYEIPKKPVCAPASIAEIIGKALQSPEHRYSEIGELIEDLEYARNSITKEELSLKIGFEPKLSTKSNEKSDKEKRFLDGLEGSTSKSISFDEHSIRTISDKRATKEGYWKVVIIPVICVALIALVLILGRVEKKEKKVISTTRESGTTKLVMQSTDEALVVIKDYKNKEYKKIAEEIKADGILVQKISKYSDKVKKGLVLEQNIISGTKVEKGSTIILTVSKGKKKTVVEESTTVIDTSSENFPEDNGEGQVDDDSSNNPFSFGDIVE